MLNFVAGGLAGLFAGMAGGAIFAAIFSYISPLARFIEMSGSGIPSAFAEEGVKYGGFTGCLSGLIVTALESWLSPITSILLVGIGFCFFTIWFVHDMEERPIGWVSGGTGGAFCGGLGAYFSVLLLFS